MVEEAPLRCRLISGAAEFHGRDGARVGDGYEPRSPDVSFGGRVGVAQVLLWEVPGA